MDFPHGETVTILPGQDDEDAYGDSESGDAAPVSWGPCAVAPRSSSERVDDRSPAVVTGLTIYGPSPGPTSRSRVRFDSGPYLGVWEVEGIPGVWRSPFTGWAPGVEVALQRASGG